MALDIDLRKDGNTNTVIRPVSEADKQMDNVVNDNDDDSIETFFDEAANHTSILNNNEDPNHDISPIDHVSNSQCSSRTPVYTPYNPVVMKDLEIIGKFWQADEEDDSNDNGLDQISTDYAV